MQQWLNTEPEVALPDHPHSPSMTPPVPDQPAAGDSVYAVGNILELNLNVDANSDSEATTIQVKVKKQQRPWTLSCGMMVEIQQAPKSLPGLSVGDEVFLKMFDRRFAQQLREDHKIDQWCEKFEREFTSGLASGKVEEFLENLQALPRLQGDTDKDWDDAENEAYLATELQMYFNSETATYARLQQHQGQAVPRLLASITLDESIATYTRDPQAIAEMVPDFVAKLILKDAEAVEMLGTQQRKVKEHRGIMLQYLPGFSLSDMIQSAPRTSWQGIVDQAVQSVNVLDDHNILNLDVRPANFMVVLKNDTYRVFMIDFGHCRFRRKDETDEEWGSAKWMRDEEGAVALVMEMRLKKAGFELQYEPTLKYLEWAPGESD
ncbi:hypothetical protein ACHAO9_009602 [Fusarium lateritium]